MNTNATTTEMTKVNSSDTPTDDVELRLAEIAAAVNTKLSTGATKRNLPDGAACPVDPAERALCEGCQ